MVHRDSDVSDRRPSLEGLHGVFQKRPLHSRFPRAYFLAPAVLRAWGRKLASLRRGSPAPLRERYLRTIAAWPAGSGAPVPVLLTHDVDTGAGFDNLGKLLAVEEASGFRSVSHLVTHRYALDRAAISGWIAKGHRFGVHDTLHDNLLPYLSADEIRERMVAAQAALGELGIRSFRSPAFLRSKALYEGISGKVDFDFSSNDSALSWPYPGDGIGSPFPVKHAGIVCAPTTLPRDGELIALGFSHEAALKLWQEKSLELARVGAPVVVLTHPDPHFAVSPDWISTYGAFLEWLKKNPDRFRIESPNASLDAIRALATQEI